MQQPPLRHGVPSRAPVGRSIADGIPAGFVVLLAAWTMSYWAALAWGWSAGSVGVATVVVLGLVTIGALGARRRPGRQVRTARHDGTSGGDDVRTPGDAPGEDPLDRVQRRRQSGRVPLAERVAVVVVVGLAGVLAVRVSKVGALLLLTVCAVALLGRQWWVSRRESDPADGAGRAAPAGPTGPTGRSGSTDPSDRGAASTSVGWWWLPGVGLAAGVMAVLSTQFCRPDGDDVYFVGFSTYVAQHGLIPLRDTLMSPQVFPAPQAYDPPLHSWETLIGLAARLAGTEATTMTYAIVLPLMAVVAVFALARVIRASGVRWPLLGLYTAVTMLVLDGADATTFGLLWITRLWVGKVVLVAVLMPMLLVYGQRWVRRREVADLLMLLATAIAGLGVSSTAVFVVPLALSAVALAALVTHQVRGAVLLLVPMAAPAVIGVLTIVLAPPPPGPAQPLPVALDDTYEHLGSSTSGLLQLFTLGGWHLGVVILAVTVGVLGLRDRAARTAVLALLVVFAVVVSPPGNAVLLSALPVLKPVIWRLWFLVPLPLLFAALPGGAVLVITGARGGQPSGGRAGPAGQRWRRAASFGLGGLVAVGAAGSFALYGPTTLSGPLTFRSSWGDLKAEPGAEDAYRLVASQARQGDVVLSPSASARLIPIATSRFFAVAPRLDYLRGGFYRSLPQVHAVDRLWLQAWVRGQSAEATSAVGRKLDLLQVDLVCTDGSSTHRKAQMRALGWRQTADGLYACFRRS